MKNFLETCKEKIKSFHPVLEQEYKTVTTLYLERDADSRGSSVTRSGHFRCDLLHTGIAVLAISLVLFLLLGAERGGLREKH